MKISLRRHNKTTILRLGPHDLYFSYDTCIAYSGPLGAYRIPNTFSVTTGRHFNELGVADFEMIESLDDVIERITEPNAKETKHEDI